MILLSSCSLFSTAQNVVVNARLDSTVMLIGSQTHLHLSVSYDNKDGLVKIQWPVISDSIISKVKVVSKSKIDTVIADSTHPTRQKQTMDVIVTSFDSGYYAIPPFQFVLNGDTAHPTLTDPLILQIQTVPVDTTKGVRDIKAPITAPFSWLEVLPYVGWGLLALAILGIIIYFIVKSTKKKKDEPIVPKEPPIEPHVKALKELEELGLKKLWQEGKMKEYHSSVSDILRAYLYGRFGVDALEMTTDEIVYAIRRADMTGELKDKLRRILVLADLVKFAKEQPLPHENENSLLQAIEFVNNTIPRQEPIKEQPVQQVPPPASPTDNPPATV
ncbi:MAG TPA: hypothetical protein VK806_13090 [Bacteroidia bacterium]|nr:hypothetical protein [Bacteroidia bacterium]